MLHWQSLVLMPVTCMAWRTVITVCAFEGVSIPDLIGEWSITDKTSCVLPESICGSIFHQSNFLVAWSEIVNQNLCQNMYRFDTRWKKILETDQQKGVWGSDGTTNS